MSISMVISSRHKNWRSALRRFIQQVSTHSICFNWLMCEPLRTRSPYQTICTTSHISRNGCHRRSGPWLCDGSTSWYHRELEYTWTNRHSTVSLVEFQPSDGRRHHISKTASITGL